MPLPIAPANAPMSTSRDDRFQLAMESSGIGMAIVDVDGRWVEVNPALQRMLGYEASEMVGRPVSAFTHSDDIESSRSYLDGLVDGRIPVLDVDKRYLHRDGHAVWARANVAVMRDAQTRPQYLVVQLRDLTGQRAAQAALDAHASERAEALDAAQRQLQLFADAVAHDLRAPLRSIESFSGLLASRAGERLDATDQDYLSRIRAAASRMSGLLGALSELSRATRAELQPTPIDLSLLAEWVCAELQDADPGRQAQVAVQPGLACEGDERLVKLMLTQLLDNAWKFSRDNPTTRIEVTGQRDGDAVRVAIRDHGVGFDARYAHKLFEPFQRLHGPEHGGGHGLGLAIAQRVAQRHGGRVTADSHDDGGSTFTIELPAVAATPAPFREPSDA